MKYIALITGASSGIGREFVRQIAAAYPSLQELWLLARNVPAMENLQKACPGIHFCILAMDLTDTKVLEELELLLKREKPCIRLLVNSAGCGKNGLVAEQDWRDACRMLDVNCKDLTAVTMICLPYLRRGSRVIQIDSGAAFLPQPGFAVYAAGKAYVLSFDRALGAELKAAGITVTSVCPGPVDTDFFQRGGITLNPWKRVALARPEQVVRKALFDAEAGRELSIYGCSVKLLRLAAKVLPHRVLVGICKRLLL